MQRKGPGRDARKERFWRDAIRQQERSGQSIRQYCRHHHLSEPSFYAWRRELKRRGGRQTQKTHHRAVRRPTGRRREAVASKGRPAFVSVQLAPGTVPLGPASASIECLLPGGVVLRLPASMEPAAIAALLRSWERSPC
jgi:transposase-like protein